MFLNFIKNIFIKRKLKNSSIEVFNSHQVTKTKSVGLLIDETSFDKKLDLIKELIKNDIDFNQINVLIYKDKKDVKLGSNEPVITMKSLNWKGEIVSKEITDFISVKYDLLINYFEEEIAPLVLSSLSTNAKFRIGFNSIDKRMNDFMIETSIDQYQVFTNEMFKYLRILKKI